MSDKTVKCVIFDCDGTLVDSEKLCCQALVTVFNRFGANYSYETALAHFSGGKIADILNKTRSYLGLNVSIDTLEPLYREEVHTLFEHHLQAMDGAHHILQLLDSRQIEYCVISNSPKEKAQHVLQLTGLMPHFKSKIFSAFEANSWKPEPDLIRYAAMNMGFTLDECLYVDDTEIGWETGCNAGIETVILQEPHRIFSPEINTISHLSMIMEWL